MLTRAEFAKETGVAVSTLKRWEKSGRLVPAHKNPRGKFYTEEQADTYKKTHSCEYGIYGSVEFAKRIKISLTTLERWVRDGSIVPAGKFENGRNYYTQAQVDEYFGN